MYREDIQCINYLTKDPYSTVDKRQISLTEMDMKYSYGDSDVQNYLLYNLSSLLLL